MLRAQSHRWTSVTLRQMILSGKLPEEYIDGTARYIKDKPTLWVVSDDEFIAAVRDVDPTCAEIFRTRPGIEFLHRMSIAIAARTLRYKVFG